MCNDKAHYAAGFNRSGGHTGHLRGTDEGLEAGATEIMCYSYWSYVYNKKKLFKILLA